MKGPDGNLKVPGPKDKCLDPKYTRRTVKHGGGKGAMVWGCFTGFNGVGPILQINGIIDHFVYHDILVPHADDKMPLLRTFQAVNDLKHKYKLVKQRFETNQIDVIKWLAQSPSLNPTKNL